MILCKIWQHECTNCSIFGRLLCLWPNPCLISCTGLRGKTYHILQNRIKYKHLKRKDKTGESNQDDKASQDSKSTIEYAITSISTQWTLLIGQIDKNVFIKMRNWQPSNKKFDLCWDSEYNCMLEMEKSWEQIQQYTFHL